MDKHVHSVVGRTILQEAQRRDVQTVQHRQVAGREGPVTDGAVGVPVMKRKQHQASAATVTVVN